VTAVGVNCTPPQHVESLLADARTATDLPLVAYPNWGRIWDGATYEWIEGTGVAEFPTDLLDRWYDAGARVIGGCCGIGPRGIAVLTSRPSRSWGAAGGLVDLVSDLNSTAHDG